MKISIIFHSVCGNTYLMAKELYENFSKQGVSVGIYRVEDKDLAEIANMFPVAKEYLNKILEIPVINLDTVVESDYIFLGCPTYFGNVSAEMKAFMDSFSTLWADAKLFGKKIIAFGSCSNPEGGGEICLKSINTFAQHLGMITIPIPPNLVPGKSNPAYGLLHYSGDMADKRLGNDIKKAIVNLVNIIINTTF